MPEAKVQKPAVGLPQFPEGKQFEEYVSAYLESGHYYLERNIIEREEHEVLELDVIATDYSNCPPRVRLFEIKSGGWGFPELFMRFQGRASPDCEVCSRVAGWGFRRGGRRYPSGRFRRHFLQMRR